MSANVIVDVAANALGGLIAAAIAYSFIEHRLRLNRDRRHRAEISRDILRALRDELQHDREVADAMLEHLPGGALPYQAFEVTGWTLVSQVPAFTALEPQTVTSLLEAYRRLRAANDQHALVFDFMYGPTGTLSLFLGATPETREARDGFARLEKRRADLRERLRKRVEDLQPHIDGALDQIERELARRKSS